MDPRAKRIAENESRFREINERLRGDLSALPASDEPVAFVCECGLLECAQPVSLTLAEYEAARADSLDFIVVPGHEIPDVEDVVDAGDHHVRVRKRPASAPVVKATDPRRPGAS